MHRNLIANVLQSEAWMQPALSNPRKGPPPDQLNFVCALPLYHIFAMTVCCLLVMRVGGFNILIPNPRDVPALVKEIRPYQVHVFPAVNTLYNAAGQQRGVPRRSTGPACASRAAAAWRCSARWPSSG